MIENVNVPGSQTRASKAMYEAMKQAMWQVLPAAAPGAELRSVISEPGLTKHGEIRALMMERLGLMATQTVSFTSRSDLLGRRLRKPERNVGGRAHGVYTGSKVPLRPIHDQVMAEFSPLGPFEIDKHTTLRRERAPAKRTKR